MVEGDGGCIRAVNASLSISNSRFVSCSGLPSYSVLALRLPSADISAPRSASQLGGALFLAGARAR
eukprot:507657-Rhodomonas_salina.1